MQFRTLKKDTPEGIDTMQVSVFDFELNARNLILHTYKACPSKNLEKVFRWT